MQLKKDQALTSLKALSWPKPVDEVLDTVFSQVPFGTSDQALPWKSILEVPAQVVPAPAAQSFLPFKATPKH